MALANTLASCLSSKNCRFEIVRHPYTTYSMATAKAAHVPGDRLAKTLLLEDESGYVTAVIPSSHHLLLAAICEQTGRKLVLADEDKIREVFKDCDVGAIPPVAMAYGMHTYLDDSLLKQPDIYFEAGDHEELVHMNIAQFVDLMADAERGHFARRVI